MPVTFIFAIITASFAAVVTVLWRIVHRAAAKEEGRRGSAYETTAEDARPWFKGFAIGFAALTVLLVLISSYNPVSTQNIGIVTSFGRPVGHLSTGLNFTAPWESVTEMDEAVQVTDYTGPGCITVRIAGGQTACDDVTIRWRVNPSGADAVFRNYKSSTAGVQAGLIVPELNRALNNVFETFNPVTQVTSSEPVGSPGNLTVGQLTQQVQAQMQAVLSSDVTIVSMFLKPVYDPVVQAKLNSISTQAGQTVVTQEQILTNIALAQSYQKLAQILAANPNVLVSQCMTNVLEPLAKSGNVPVGFSCWPGGGVTGIIANPGK